MRRFLFIITLAFTFAVGVWFARVSVALQSKPVSLCEAVENTALYSGQKVRMKLFLTGNYITDPNCGGEEGKWADIKLESQPEYHNLIGELKRLNTADSLAMSEVIVIGEFQYVGANCTSSAHLLSEAHIEQAMPIKVKLVNQTDK